MLSRGGEIRIKDPWTGGEKGQKPERFSLLPFDALDEILRAYHYGASKYADHNWRRGYKWSLSFDAALRHLTAWWEREDLDKESGLSHLAHAGWHILCLLWFSLNAKGTDDRWLAGEDPARQEVPSPSTGSLKEALVGASDLEDVRICASLWEAQDAVETFGTFSASHDPITGTWRVSREVKK